MSGAGRAHLFRKENYIVHDFLTGNPVMINRAEMSLTFFHHNLYGQLYDLNTAKPHFIDAKRINGLIRRTSRSDYGFDTAKVVDSYIYAYLMSPEQRKQCLHKPTDYYLEKVITASDDYGEAIGGMCEWVYDNHYSTQLDGKEGQRDELLQYYKNHLINSLAPQPAKPPLPPQSRAVKKGKKARGGTSR